MRAARFHGNRDIRIEEVPEPQIRPGTVKVRVEWCGICELPENVKILVHP